MVELSSFCLLVWWLFFFPSGRRLEADREGLAKWTRETMAIPLGNEKGHSSAPKGLSLERDSHGGLVKAERTSHADEARATVYVRGSGMCRQAKVSLSAVMPTAQPQALLSLD